MAGAAVGIAAAQAQPTPTTAAKPGYQKFVDALAKRLNLTPANLETAITQARSDAGLPAGAEFPGGKGGHGGPGGRGPRTDLTAAATVIGISAEQLRSELNGKSLAEVATAHGKSPSDVAIALKNAAHTRIDAAVTAGKLPADQASTRKTQIDQRIDQLMNQVAQRRA